MENENDDNDNNIENENENEKNDNDDNMENENENEGDGKKVPVSQLIETIPLRLDSQFVPIDYDLLFLVDPKSVKATIENEEKTALYW